jgi:hypothetical protein
VCDSGLLRNQYRKINRRRKIKEGGMDIQKTMQAWDNFVWAVLEGGRDISTEDRKDGIRKVANAWLVQLFHESRSEDPKPLTSLETAELALDVLQTLYPLLEEFHHTIGACFNEKQFEELEKRTREQT